MEIKNAIMEYEAQERYHRNQAGEASGIEQEMHYMIANAMGELVFKIKSLLNGWHVEQNNQSS